MIYKNRREFVHNEEIQNNLGMDDIEFVKLCHKLSAAISDKVQELELHGLYGEFSETICGILDAIQSVLPGKHISIDEKGISLEGEDGKRSCYGVVTFKVNGAEVRELYFEKPYRISNKEDSRVVSYSEPVKPPTMKDDSKEEKEL